MANYLIRNVATDAVFGPYPEDKVPAMLWGRKRDEWTIFKQVAGDSQAVVNRICERRRRDAENRRLSPKNEKIADRS